MTLRLDTPWDAGGWRLAALSDTRVAKQRLGSISFGEAIKTPVAFVLSDGVAIHAMDLKGRRLDVETLDAACPGLIARMVERA